MTKRLPHSLVITLALVATRLATSASAQEAKPAETPASVEDQLRRQNEMIQAQNEVIHKLAEQNKLLGDRLESITKRLDKLSGGDAPPTSVLPPPPPGNLPSLGGSPDGEKPPLDAPPIPAPLTPGPTEPKPKTEEPPPIPASATTAAAAKPMSDSLHDGSPYGFRELFDSLHPEGAKGKPWYEKLSLRGYSQVRFGKTLYYSGVRPSLISDAFINGFAEDFSIRRARLILSGDLSDRVSLYLQTDFANVPPSSQGQTFYAQVRDLYADIHLDADKVNRFRVGQSKIPYGFEVMQSSGNRVSLDRSDAIDTGTLPNQRDLGVFYYWTPVAKQKLLRDLVEGGLKGSGNYGVFALGTYNGEGGSIFEKNLSPYIISRLTWPFRLENGQVMEASVQGYAGRYVVTGAPIRPLGKSPAIVPDGTNGNLGLLDERVAWTFVYYPQPWGFQAEWNVGRGPGITYSQTDVTSRPINGGYVMGMYKLDTPRNGIFTPYLRYQNYLGGYRLLPNAPYGRHNQWDVGVEWQIRKELELTTEYSFVNGINLDPINEPGVRPYQTFDAGVLRFQLQLNY